MSKILGHALKLRCSGTNPLPQSGKASQIWAKPTRPQNYCILGLVVWHIFLTNVKQGTNLPFAWMCLTIWKCNAAHTSRVTSKFSSVETMHTTQSLIGSRSHQGPSAVQFGKNKDYFWMSGPMTRIVLALSIIHRTMLPSQTTFKKKFSKATAKGSFEKELSWNTG